MAVIEAPRATDGDAHSASRPAPAVEFRNFGLSYNGHLALSAVTASVRPGSRVAIVGPNGAGKSTLFKGLIGLLPVRTGEALIDGKPAAKSLRQVAYVPQREEIDWAFPVTALDVVLMGCYGRLGWLRRPGRAERAIAESLLAEMGIAPLSGRAISDLSGGEQQRVFLARALAQEPRLLLLDEPFAGVDVTTQEATLALLDRLGGRGVTMLVSTHDLDLAAERFDTIMLLNGRLIAYGPPSEVLTPPALAEVFGAPRVFFQNGERYLALMNQACPPERTSYHGDVRREVS
jgi:ABC-type Mn2+/Zn2+ transport system ATPase subunit